jgi:hypothetical protein
MLTLYLSIFLSKKYLSVFFFAVCGILSSDPLILSKYSATSIITQTIHRIIRRIQRKTGGALKNERKKGTRLSGCLVRLYFKALE